MIECQACKTKKPAQRFISVYYPSLERFCYVCDSCRAQPLPRKNSPTPERKPEMSKSKPKLTRRQEQVLNFIGTYREKMGFQPTIREIGAELGMSSSSTVHIHLKNLESKGYLKRSANRARGYEILDRVDPIKRAQELIEVAKLAEARLRKLEQPGLADRLAEVLAKVEPAQKVAV